MKTNVIIIATVLMALSGCNSRNRSQNNPGKDTLDSSKNIVVGHLENKLIIDVTGWQSSSNKKVFLLVETDNGNHYINAWSKLIIYNDQVLFDRLDMELFTFGIKKITHIGDSIIKFQLNKQSSGVVYDDTIEWDELWDTDREFGEYIRNNKTLVWDIYYNRKHFKWNIIDSLDAERSGLPYTELDEEEDDF